MESLQLLGPDWLVLAQTDSLPVNSEVLTTRWPADKHLVQAVPLPVPASTSSGRYTLNVGLYQLASGSRLPIAGSATVLPLGAVTVTAAP